MARGHVRSTGRASEVLHTMCLFLSLLLFGPRIVIVFWWLFEPCVGRLPSTRLLPFLGFLFLPWTTLMYVLVSPGGLDGLDLLWIGLAVAADLASYAGGRSADAGAFRGCGSPS